MRKFHAAPRTGLPANLNKLVPGPVDSNTPGKFVQVQAALLRFHIDRSRDQEPVKLVRNIMMEPVKASIATMAPSVSPSHKWI